MKMYASRTSAEIAVERLKIYAQPQRLMILSFLDSGEHTVSEIEEATGVGQPALSQQLAELRRADIVKTRRASKLVYYRLADDNVAICIRSIEAMFGDHAIATNAPVTTVLEVAPVRHVSRPMSAAAFVKLDSQ
jgi:DNA-binding transcriptional ArsR family regulator